MNADLIGVYREALVHRRRLAVWETKKNVYVIIAYPRALGRIAPSWIKDLIHYRTRKYTLEPK